MAVLWRYFYFLIVLSYKNAATRAEENQKQERNDAANYFIKYGYLKDYSDSTDEVVFSATLQRFQRFAGLEVTGKLNEETKKQFGIPRCGLSDPLISSRKRRYLLQGNKWDLSKFKDRKLSWILENEGSGLGRNSIIEEIKKAFALWQKYGNIKFSEAAGEKADIKVKFANKCHGDPFCFDGKGGTLAHAFYPYPGHGISGDVHFDDDETYVIGKSTGTDLLWVATHEIGHSLGLDHSDKKGAIMFPWYQGYKKDFDLTNDDINGIIDLYGAATLPQTEAPPIPTTATNKPTAFPSTRATVETIVSTEKETKKLMETSTERPTERSMEMSTEASTLETTTRKRERKRPTYQISTKPATNPNVLPTKLPTMKTERATTSRRMEATPIMPSKRSTKNPYKYNMRYRCTKFIDAAFISRRFRWMMVFTRDRFYLANRNGIRHGPLVAKQYYSHIDGMIDAALENDATGETIIFSGPNLWVYRGFSRRAGPLPLKLAGLDESVSQIDAALRWKRNGIYYLFSGIRYWRFNPLQLRVDKQAYPKYIRDHWLQIPEYLSAVVTDFDGVTRFIKDDLFYTLIDRAAKADLKSTGRVGDAWMKCRATKAVQQAKIQEYTGPLAEEP